MRVFAGVTHDGSDPGCWVCDEVREAEATKVLYRVPDTTRQRQLIDEALRTMRRDSAIERARWAAYAATAREFGLLA